jgi:hydroxymethylglutaryl-CoA lyase
MPEVKICDVSLRDGMQILNRHAVIPLEARLQLIEALIRAGVPYIEVGSFVNPRVVPAMRDTAELLRRIPPYSGQIAALAPTLDYYNLLKQAERVNTVALFVSASEEYSQKNTHMSVSEALAAAEKVANAARSDGYRLRGYLSYAFRDPSQPDGLTSADEVAAACGRLVEMGCETIALSDTDGMASPNDIARVVGKVADRVDLDYLGVHLHDRRGLGITNAYAAYRAGVRSFDASIGGIGGAITVRHSIGNISTEELVCMFDSIGAETGIDVAPLVEAGLRVSQMADFVGDPPPPSKIILDELAKRRAEVEETEGIEADLSLRELVGSLIGILGKRPHQLTMEAVTHTLDEARKQVSLFLEAPTNRAAVIFSLLLMLMVSGVAALFVRVLPTPWVARSEVIAITLFSLAMVLLLGFGLTMIQVAGGLKFRRSLSPGERQIVREAVSEVAAELKARSSVPRTYEGWHHGR